MSKPSNRRRGRWASRRSIFSRLRRRRVRPEPGAGHHDRRDGDVDDDHRHHRADHPDPAGQGQRGFRRGNRGRQAGLESFLSWVNTNCPPTSGYLCSALATGVTNKSGITDPTNQKGVGITGGDGATSSESYWWTVTYAVSGFARVKSVGQVPTNKTNPKYLTKTLVADVNATPSFNNFQYYTKYETIPPSSSTTSTRPERSR